MSGERHSIPISESPFRPLVGGRLPADVLLRVGPSDATSPAAQHFAWMSLNLLARLDDVVGTVFLDLPRSTAVQVRHLSPFSGEANLLGHLQAAGRVVRRKCEVVPYSGQAVAVAVGFGSVELPPPGLRSVWAAAMGWAGAVRSRPIGEWDASADVRNPVGPYVAACLAVGEAFKALMDLDRDRGDYFDDFGIDAYGLRSGVWDALEREGGDHPSPEETNLGRFYLAGCGAVGNSFAHVLWGLDRIRGEAILIDRSDNELGPTNLNRYVMVCPSDLPKRRKALVLAERLARVPGLSVIPFDTGWAQVAKEVSEKGEAAALSTPARPVLANPRPFEHVVCCVDTNRSRRALQDVLPHTLMLGSTLNLRARFSRYDLSPGGGACIKCFNPAEPDLADETIIDRFRALLPEGRTALAQSMGIPSADVEAWLVTDCPNISQEAKAAFRDGNASPQWSASFCSGLAGTLLAAQYLRRCLTDGRSARSSSSHDFCFLTPNLLHEEAGRETGCECTSTALRQAWRMKWG